MTLSRTTTDFLRDSSNAYFTPSWVPERYREGYSATMLAGSDASKKAFLEFVQGCRTRADKQNFVRVHFGNVLGGDSKLGDPFEYEMDCGPAINPIKYKVENLLIPKTAGQKKPDPADLAADAKYGPTLHEFCPPDLWQAMKEAAKSSGFNMENMVKIEATFYSKYANTPLFFATRNSPGCLLCLDKNLRENGLPFDYPIVSSPAPLSTAEDLVTRLMSPTSLAATEDLTKKWDEITLEARVKMAEALESSHPGIVYFQDYEVCKTREGQAVWYTWYQLLNRCILEKAGLIDGANKVKALFFKDGLGNSLNRAEFFRAAFTEAQSGAALTAEAGPEMRSVMAKGYLPTDLQVSKDGSLIFLNKNIWESYKIIPLEIRNRLGEIDLEGKAQAVLATRKDGSGRDILGACHGSAKDLVEALRQIETFKRMWDELRVTDPTVGLMIGIDANTNDKDEEGALVGFCKILGLKVTLADPTTVKRRRVTVQHSKANEPIFARKSYIITLEKQPVANETVAFKQEPLDANRPLPREDMQSDHATLGLDVYPLKEFEYPPVQTPANVNADAFVKDFRHTQNIKKIMGAWKTPKENAAEVGEQVSCLLQDLQQAGLTTTKDNREKVANAIRGFLKDRGHEVTPDNLATIGENFDEFFRSLPEYGLVIKAKKTAETEVKRERDRDVKVAEGVPTREGAPTKDPKEVAQLTSYLAESGSTQPTILSTIQKLRTVTKAPDRKET